MCTSGSRTPYSTTSDKIHAAVQNMLCLRIDNSAFCPHSPRAITVLHCCEPQMFLEGGGAQVCLGLLDLVLRGAGVVGFVILNGLLPGAFRLLKEKVFPVAGLAACSLQPGSIGLAGVERSSLMSSLSICSLIWACSSVFSLEVSLVRGQ